MRSHSTNISTINFYWQESSQWEISAADSLRVRRKRNFLKGNLHCKCFARSANQGEHQRHEASMANYSTAQILAMEPRGRISPGDVPGRWEPWPGRVWGARGGCVWLSGCAGRTRRASKCGSREPELIHVLRAEISWPRFWEG